MKLLRLQRRPRARFGPALLLVCALPLLSCSGYAGKVQRLRTEVAAGQPAAALATLNGLYDADERSLPYLMERGLLQYLSGDLEGAQVSLAAAEQLVDELYTRSLSRELARLLINDTLQEYRGELFEGAWIHYYRALAYLAAGAPQSAAVEGRAATQTIDRMAATGPDEAKYRNDPFLQYFAGLLYEMDGELNDAWINYREAERLYQAHAVYGVAGPPDCLLHDLFRAGERLGFDEELARYREAYPDLAVPRPAPGEGELVLLVETGLVPGKVSERIDFPIFTQAEGDDNAESAFHIAGDSYGRWRAGDIREQELAYWLSIALPAVAPGAPAPELRWSAGAAGGALAPAANLGALSHQCLEDRYAAVVIRTVARGLLKYWSTKKMEEEHGKGAGFLTNLLGSVTEVADTRAWSSLPAHVAVARLALPAGPQRIRVQGTGGGAEAEVDIAPGRLQFLALRLY
ncbi:hypothetical protein FJ251_12045 [bacterium]|nr:hypothetical protein [bacterium]